MRIIIAGAGAGKTTSMAKSVLERYRDLEEDKIIYVINIYNGCLLYITTVSIYSYIIID